ncbi:hypothetical protein L6Q96_20785 [Candidatus Binatia bacterium]|nr:hypothetical protein [Candidatus Binatia bacterium]
MRTTIEITEQQRGELLKIASSRGEKGFSSVVREAVDLYLRVHASRQDAVRAALGVRGALAGQEGEALKADVAAIRRRWR